MPGRRRARAARSAPSPTADELAVHAAEAIVGRAWAELLLRYYDRMDRAFHLAREQSEAAAGRLVTAQRCGDPNEIGLAHAALERALNACRTSEAAREQGRQSLQAALTALAYAGSERADPASAGQVEGGGPIAALAPAPPPRQEPTADWTPRAARRKRWRWRFRHLHPRRAPDPGQQ